MIDQAQLCNLCLDDEGAEVSAVIVIAGVPLCRKHSTSTEERRFQAQKQRDEVVPSKPTSITRSQSAIAADAGIKTAKDFALLMGSLMKDILSGKVKPEEAKAICAAGDRLLKVTEMQLRYEKNATGNKQLLLGEPQA